MNNTQMPSTNSVIAGCGFHHVALWTATWDKTLRFYCEGLGLSARVLWGEAPGRAALLDIGDGTYLEIFERKEASTLSGEPNLLHLCFRTDDCAAAVEVARSAGAEITTEAFQVEGFAKIGLPTTIAFVKGPSGEIIEFLQSDKF